jgi:hypothetical protein
MNAPRIVAAAALVIGGFAACTAPASAQDVLLNATYINSTTYGLEIPCYVIQVQYVMSPQQSFYGGRYGYGQRTYFKWVTLAETYDLEEAMFIHDLYKLAEQRGILHEVVPEMPGMFPYRVRMITEYEPLLLYGF